MKHLLPLIMVLTLYLLWSCLSSINATMAAPIATSTSDSSTPRANPAFRVRTLVMTVMAMLTMAQKV